MKENSTGPSVVGAMPSARKLTRAEIIALPTNEERWEAIKQYFTEDEMRLLEEAVDQILALPADQQLELAGRIADFAKNRMTN